MSETGVTIGHGTTVRIGRDDPVVFTKLIGIGDVQFPENVADEIETTHQESPGGQKEFIAGLTDNGEVTVEMHWVPGNSSDVLLKAIRASRETVQIEFLAPGMTEPEIYAGFCKGWNRTSPVNSQMMGEATFRISGQITSTVF